MNLESNVANNFRIVQEKIELAKVSAGRLDANIVLTAVTKTKTVEIIRCALKVGHRVFGENRVHEAMEKWLPLKEQFIDIKLHLIGPLQTNKVKQAVSTFDIIETVDRPKLARELAKAFNETGLPLDCFIQINTGDEKQKSGVSPKDADVFIKRCINEFQLPIVGLMCIPPIQDEPSLHFALLAKIAERNGLTQLSMGMSTDYKVAIAFGATEVRIGKNLFGARSSF